MSNFTPAEIEYFKSQRLGRLATVNEVGQPHVIPVTYLYNAGLDTLDIGGLNIGRSKKVRDITRHPLVAFVVDDVLPPWQPRGIEVRGQAQVLPTGGQAINKDFAPEVIRIVPKRIIAWGIDGDAYHSSSRKIE